MGVSYQWGHMSISKAGHVTEAGHMDVPRVGLGECSFLCLGPD